MGNSTVGACTIDVASYQCSIDSIVVSTKWKGPTSEVPEKASATVFKSSSPSSGKEIYIITSPEGKKVTLKTSRYEGQCPRDNHKKYVMVCGKQKKEEGIKKEQELTITYPKIEGIKEPFKYINFPIPPLKDNTTTFKYISCKQGSAIVYKVIPYPDISFKLEGSIGAEAKKLKNGTPRFESKTKALKNVPARLKSLKGRYSLKETLNFSPSLTASTTFNGEKGEMEVTINFDKEKEWAHAKYRDDSFMMEFGSEALQDVKGTLKKFTDLIDLLIKLCEIDFIKKLSDFDPTKLVAGYQPYELAIAPPNVLVCLEGKYHVSKDLSRIGKYIDLGVACEPFIQLSFKIDLLFLILSAASAGTATGIYVMLKKLDKVLGQVLGKSYRKKYKDSNSVEADIYINLIISGAVNGSIHYIYDSTVEKQKNSGTLSVEGVLKVDLEAGAKCKLDIFVLAVEAELSGSASSGIKIKVGAEVLTQQGKGFFLVFKGIFLGLKLKYCLSGKVGKYKTASAGAMLDGDATLLEESELFSNRLKLFD